MYIHFIHIYTWIDAESGIHYFNLCNLIIRNLNHNFNTYYKEFLLGLKENDGREEKPLRASCSRLLVLHFLLQKCGSPALFPVSYLPAHISTPMLSSQRSLYHDWRGEKEACAGWSGEIHVNKSLMARPAQGSHGGSGNGLVVASGHLGEVKKCKVWSKRPSDRQWKLNPDTSAQTALHMWAWHSAHGSCPTSEHQTLAWLKYQMPVPGLKPNSGFFERSGPQDYSGQKMSKTRAWDFTVSEDVHKSPFLGFPKVRKAPWGQIFWSVLLTSMFQGWHLVGAWQIFVERKAFITDHSEL